MAFTKCGVTVSWILCLTITVILVGYQGWQILEPGPLDGATTGSRSLSANDKAVMDEPYILEKRPGRPSATFLYVVGVEGVGHHGVTPAVITIASSCDQIVDYASPILHKMRSLTSVGGYRSYLKGYAHENLPRVAFLEDQSFPTDALKRSSTAEEKKAVTLYNLEWMHAQAHAVGINMKFLYLTRDFYRTVASHRDLDGGFEEHAQVMYEYTQHIHAEYEAISRRQPGLWRQVRYEWFTELRNCTALVSAIIDFAGWDHCNPEYACRGLRKVLRGSSPHIVNATQHAYAQRFNMTSPVPLLDISDGRAYDEVRFNSSWRPGRDTHSTAGNIRVGIPPALRGGRKGTAPVVRTKSSSVGTLYGKYQSKRPNETVAIKFTTAPVAAKPRSFW